jgi:hypothetical protein
MKLSFEDFVYYSEWLEIVRMGNFVGEYELRKIILKKIREFRRGRPLFAGPYGDKSAWAGMVRNWYKAYVEEA